MTDRTVLLIGTGLYAAAFIAGLVALLLRRRYPRPAVLGLLGGGLLLQTVGLNMRGAAIQACPLGNPFEIAHFIVWSLVVLFFIIGPVFKLRMLGLFTAALASALLLATLPPAFDRSYPAGLFGGNPWIELHAALAIFSYSVFAVLALVSAMFLAQEHGLKTKRFTGIYQYLPSISQLDRMSQRLLFAGLASLTLALAVGAVFWIGHLSTVPPVKLGTTLLVWAGYVVIAVLRLRGQVTTRRGALACIALFAAALLSLWPVDQSRPERQTDTVAARP